MPVIVFRISRSSLDFRHFRRAFSAPGSLPHSTPDPTDRLSRPAPDPHGILAAGSSSILIWYYQSKFPVKGFVGAFGYDPKRIPIDVFVFSFCFGSILP
jgi:hypothetical protein